MGVSCPGSRKDRKCSVTTIIHYGSKRTRSDFPTTTLFNMASPLSEPPVGKHAEHKALFTAALNNMSPRNLPPTPALDPFRRSSGQGGGVKTWTCSKRRLIAGTGPDSCATFHAAGVTQADTINLTYFQIQQRHRQKLRPRAHYPSR